MFFSLQFFRISLHLGSLWLTSSSILFEAKKNSNDFVVLLLLPASRFLFKKMAIVKSSRLLIKNVGQSYRTKSVHKRHNYDESNIQLFFWSLCLQQQLRQTSLFRFADYVRL